MSDSTDSPLGAVLQELPFEKFSEVLQSSPRKAREIYFKRHGIKKPKTTNKVGGFKDKREGRIQALFEVIQQTEDPQMAEEMLRSWCLSKRPLLAAALDYLDIPHRDGLTDSDDIEKIADMSAKELKAMVAHIRSNAAEIDDSDIKLYLQFMGAKNIGKAI